MAMPALPASIHEPPPLDEVILRLAQTMAESIGEQVGDVLARTKSKSWMLGRLRRAYQGTKTDDEIRAAMDRLARQHHRSAPRTEVTVTELPREQRWLEYSQNPIWQSRVLELGGILAYPMTAREIIDRAAVVLRWNENPVKQSLAACEIYGEAWYDPAFNFWQRTPERILMANSKGKTVRVQRHLPVKVTDEGELKRRLSRIDTEAEALEASLAEERRRVAAELKRLVDKRERTLESWKTGVETQLVECEERWSYQDREVTTVRKDTGEVVERREMTAEELQLRMPEQATT
jgi:hypothetical protein